MSNLTVPSWCKDQQQFLSIQVTNNALAHAYLISSGKGTGKLALAHWLVGVFACNNRQIDADDILQACQQCKPCLLKKASTYPDEKLIDQAGATVSVDAIRETSNFLQKTSQIGSGQSVIINHAEDMTIAAANALLKTLEEPTANTLLILLTENSEHLLPTIISRCQIVSLKTLSGSELSKHFNDKRISNLANMTFLPELQSSELHQHYIEMAQAFTNFLVTPSQRALFLQALNGHKRSIVWLERVVTTLMRDKEQLIKEGALTHNDLVTLTKVLNSDSLPRIFQLILAFNQKAKTLVQANDAMLKEKLVIEIAQLMDKLEA